MLSDLAARAQFLMDMIDTTKELGKNNSADRLSHIRISGYMQPQFQIASAEGADSYSGGGLCPQFKQPFHAQKGANSI